MDTLTAEELQRCPRAMLVFGMVTADHFALHSDRHLALHLAGLSANDVGGAEPISQQEFSEMRQILVRAGALKLRGLLASGALRGVAAPSSRRPDPEQSSHAHSESRQGLSAVEERIAYDALGLFDIESDKHPALESDRDLSIHLSSLTYHGLGKHEGLTFEDFRTLRRLLTRAGAHKLRKLVTGGPPPLPPEVEATLPKAKRAPAAPPKPQAPVLSRRVPTRPAATEPAVPTPSRGTVPAGRPPVDVPATPVPTDSTPEAPEGTAPTKPAVRVMQLVSERRFAQAFAVGFNLISTAAELDPALVDLTASVVEHASESNPAAHIVPVNLLKECQALAKLLEKHIPFMTLNTENPDAMTVRLMHMARRVYLPWAMHCHAIFEHRYKFPDGSWLRRENLSPSDFGPLMDVMSQAVHSKLPLNLLYEIYEELLKTLEIGRHVLMSQKKAARFEGDVLRIIASPTKDVIPDLCLTIFRRIIKAYMEEGDSAQAWTFCMQALLIRNGDRELEELKYQIEHMRHNQPVPQSKGQGPGPGPRAGIGTH